MEQNIRPDTIKNIDRLIEETESRAKETWFHRLRRDWIYPLAVGFLIAALIRIFIVQPFKIPSGSMEDTLLVGDHLFAAKFTYGLHNPFGDGYLLRYGVPETGDVVIFIYPGDPSKDYIKRCIAVGGQQVQITNKEVYVDGELVEPPPTARFSDGFIQPAHVSHRDNYGPVTVPAGHMFVMGDNRDDSYDSRYWGFVPYENIRGKAVCIWWSWNYHAPVTNLFARVRWNRLFHPIE